MNLPVTNLPDRKAWSAAVSPSNLAMAALVGFLFVGQATDWKILFGRKAKANSSVKFGSPELSRSGVHPSRHVRAGTVRDAALHAPNLHAPNKGDPNSEVADRRAAPREEKSPGDLD